MKDPLHEDSLNIEQLFSKVQEQSIDYLNSLNARPTSVQNRETDTFTLPMTGEGTLHAIKIFNERHEPTIAATSGPRYLGFVTGGTTPASIVGDWLTSVYDQNTFATKGDGDISGHIEQETIHLLLDLLGLPNDFLGGFVTGATMSNFSCLAVARQWLGKQLGYDIAKEGVKTSLNILTATPHSSAVKSIALLGLGSASIINIKTINSEREAVDIQALEETIKKLNGAPFILISSGGTVNTVDYDDFTAIKRLKGIYNFWWHIDAAFGAFAVCTKEYNHLLKDWEFADSITVDCHKWLNVPYESAVFFVKEKHKNLQVDTFQNSNAPYLGDPLENFSYLNFLPENSRRFKALPTWFSLVAYGKEGYRALFEKSISLAQQFGDFIDEHDQFQLLAPVRLNTVCFSLSGDASKERVHSFLKALNASNQVFMTPTHFNNHYGIRAAFVNWRTTENDLQLIKKIMTQSLSEI